MSYGCEGLCWCTPVFVLFGSTKVVYSSYRINVEVPFDVHQCIWAYRLTPISYRTHPPPHYRKTILPGPETGPRRTIPPMPGTAGHTGRALVVRAL
jgi:hypothetical protein